MMTDGGARHFSRAICPPVLYHNARSTDTAEVVTLQRWLGANARLRKQTWWCVVSKELTRLAPTDVLR